MKRQGATAVCLALGLACAVEAACGSQSPGTEASNGDDGDGGSTVNTGSDASPVKHDGAIDAPGSTVDAAPLPPVDGGLGPPQFGSGELDPPSHGATITFQQIGATGWYPSRRDPATGPCDVQNSATCCTAKQEITSDKLTPWDEELTLTLRGPMQVKQMAVYQPSAGDAASWALVSAWDGAHAAATQGFTFDGDATPKAPFAGGVGSECLTDISSAEPFACGAGSIPYCPAPPATKHKGWAGSKLFVILANMPHAATAGVPAACSTTTTGNWYDASWIGLAVGELSRAGSFASCQCFAKDPAKWYLADGCGQFNVMEVVNDNNSYKNLDVFSTNMIDYAGYVGQGPCGAACDPALLGAGADLIDKKTGHEATAGAVATPAGGPNAAFRRPSTGYRYLLFAFDVDSRTIQLAMIHPQNMPVSLASILPNLPASLPRSAIDGVLNLRLPK